MPVLRIKSGPEKGRVVPIGEKPITIGRDASETIQIVDQGASRRHAEIFKIGEMVFIRDLNSKNGSFVNDERVTEELLQLGDKIKIGTTLFVFDEGISQTDDAAARIEFTKEEMLGATMEIDLRGRAETGLLSKDDSVWSTNLKTLYSLAEAVGTAGDEQSLMDKVVQLAADAVDADAGYIFVRDERAKLLPVAILEKRTDEGRKISRSIIKRVLKTEKALLTSDATSDERFRENQSVVMKRIRSVICAPLAAFDKVSGVLYLHGSKIETAFSAADLELVTAMGVQAGAALMHLSSSGRSLKTLLGAVRAMITAFELRNPERKGHSGRVCIWASAIAHEMGLNSVENREVQIAALLHDIGKIVASDKSAIINTAGGYAPEDHVNLGVDIVGKIDGMERILPGIKHHHERFNGSGFPGGLKGEDIPLIARIIAVADAFDHLSKEVDGGFKPALVALGRNSEGLFDPKVTEALLLAYRNGTLFAPERLLMGEVEASVE